MKANAKAIAKKRTLPTEISASPIGSLITAFYILNRSPSYFQIIKKWKKFKATGTSLSFNDIPSLVHSIAIYFNLKEADDLPIYCVAANQRLYFTVGILEREVVDDNVQKDVVQLLPNTPDGIPYGWIAYPEKVYTLKGDKVPFDFRGFTWSIGY